MDYEAKRRSFVERLVTTHEWRFALDVGDAVDARDSTTTAALLDAWREARVRSIDEDTIQVHFRGCGVKSSKTLSRFSSDLQPLNTFTKPWRAALAPGSQVELRSPEGTWESARICDTACETTSSPTRRDKGTRSEPGDKAVQKVLLAIEGGGGRRWLLRDSEDIADKGTHIAVTESTASTNLTAEAALFEPQAAAPALREDEYRGSSDAPPSYEKRVALVGSSGGGAAAQGQFDALSLLQAVKKELGHGGIELAAVQYIACSDPLDLASPASAATLWTARGKQGFAVEAEGTLSEVNAVARKVDAEIAASLEAGASDDQAAACRDGMKAKVAEDKEGAERPPLDGLVAVSCDASDVNRRALRAARDHGSPIVGTGGTSLGSAAAMGCVLVGSSGGSVATTNNAKAVSYAAGLTGHWRLRYDSMKQLARPLAPAATFAGCLPAFVGVMVALAIGAGSSSGAHGSSPSEDWALSLKRANSVVAAVVAARQVSSLDDMATSAGILAGCMCWDDVVGALFAGTLSGYLCSRLAGWALHAGVPATALSLYVSAASGILSGAAVMGTLPFLEGTRAALASTADILRQADNPPIQAATGAAMGCLMCYGSKVGWYHRVFLPLIVLELADGRASIWGAIDLCTLCMVAAGLCAAHLLRPGSDRDKPLAKRGFLFNVFFGDFVEAAYPFMERCGWCNAGGYLGSALSGAIVALTGVRSSAYLPLPVAYAVSVESLWLIIASSASFSLAFLCGIVRPVRQAMT